MWEKAKWFAMPLLAFCCFCFSPGLGSCSEAAEDKTTEAMSVSKEDWMQLKKNNDEQRRALKESQIALNEAKEALSASRAALDESERELESSKVELDALRKEYELQKAELMTLKEELRTQKNESATASDALTRANQFLKNTKEEIEAREAAWRKRETQLERQRTLWQIVAVFVGGIALST